MVDAGEYARWRADAQGALEAARRLADVGAHNWACFLTEQSAHLAVKALLHAIGFGPWGHDLVEHGKALREKAGAPEPEDLAAALMRLAKHYIPARIRTHTRVARPASDTGLRTLRRLSPTQGSSSLTSTVSGPLSEKNHQMTVERSWARDVVARRRLERDDKIAIAKGFADDLPPELDVKAAVVFGSVARGDFNRWSDIDVLIVAEHLPASGFERLSALQPWARPKVQPVAWTSAELQDRRRRKDPIALEADRCGVVVRGQIPP